MSRWTIVVFTSLLAASMPASASYISIFLDAGATTCIAQVGPTRSSSIVLWVPADGTEIVLNGDAAGGCGVAVHRSSWTTIKCLYR